MRYVRRIAPIVALLLITGFLTLELLHGVLHQGLDVTSDNQTCVVCVLHHTPTHSFLDGSAKVSELSLLPTVPLIPGAENPIPSSRQLARLFTPRAPPACS